MAEAAFDGKALVELKLHPITLGFGKPRHVRGRPLAADEELSRKIVSDLARLSKPFGTEVQFVDGAGIVKLNPPATN